MHSRRIPCQRWSFLVVRAGTVSSSMTLSMTGMSMTREALWPKRMLPTGTSKGARVTATPETSTRLKTLAPITLPIPREACPFFRLVMVVTSSGREVPRATSDNGLGNAQASGDDGAMLHQQVSAHGDQSGAENQPEQILEQRSGLLAFLNLFHFHSIGVLHALTDGDDQVNHEDHQHDQAHGTGEPAHDVGGHAVDGGAAEEEDNGHLHGLGVDGTGIHSHGDGGDQSGVADDGADGVAVCHGTLAQHGAGGGDHDLGQRGADGNDSGAHDDVRQVEPAGDAGGTVDKPVAALDQQDQTDREQKNRYDHFKISPYFHGQNFLPNGIHETPESPDGI